MELSQEQKNKIIDARLQQYNTKIFELELDLIALQTCGDEEGVKLSEQRINALRTAYDAVEALKCGEVNANA